VVNRIITAIQLPRIAPSQERIPGARVAGPVAMVDEPNASPDERTA
jgi:hypothetical protein